MAEPLDEDEAQALHDKRRAESPDHDRGSCWCCCIDCEQDPRMDFATVMKETRRRSGRRGRSY